ncbi:MAG: hemolysin III family protein [Anaerolineales bacterium]
MREPFNGISHLLAALASVVGVIWLLVEGWDEPLRRSSLLIYGLTLFLMFASSSAYHSITARPETMLLLKKFDHTAIYLLIAGSYTPICLHFFQGFWRWPFLAIIWSLALAGVMLKLFLIHTPRWITAGLYLMLGWLSVFAFGEILRSFPPGALIWLVLGGFFFTVGALVYTFKKPDLVPGRFGFHELWHIFVILGAFSHFMLIARFVA